jgi:hypothetical protein
MWITLEDARFWIGVASRDHVQAFTAIGAVVTGDVYQPVTALHPADWDADQIAALVELSRLDDRPVAALWTSTSASPVSMTRAGISVPL